MVLSKSLPCILVSSSTKWEEGWSGLSTVGTALFDLPLYSLLVPGKPAFLFHSWGPPIYTIPSFLCSEGSARLAIPGWGCPNHIHTVQREGAPLMCRSGTACSSELLYFQRKVRLPLLDAFWKERKLVDWVRSFTFLSSLFLGTLWKAPLSQENSTIIFLLSLSKKCKENSCQLFFVYINFNSLSMSTNLLSGKERFISSDWKLKCLGVHSLLCDGITVWICYLMISSSIPFPKCTNSNEYLLCAKPEPLFSRHTSSIMEGKADVQSTIAQSGVYQMP